MPTTTITAPDDLDFAALQLARDADGHGSFVWGPIDAICRASGIDPSIFADGPPDPTAEDLIGEVRAEDQLGDGTSHAPGRA